MDFPPAAPLGPPGHFHMEPDHHVFGQENRSAYRGKGQYRRCDDEVSSSNYRAELNIAPSTVPSRAGTGSRMNSRSVDPVAPVSAPPQPPFVAPLESSSTPPAPEVQPVEYASEPTHNQLPEEPSPRSRAATQKAYARMDTSVLMPRPQLPFATDHNVSELAQFYFCLERCGV